MPAGKIPSNYEENKQWFPAVNGSPYPIEPFCPCTVVRGLRTRGQENSELRVWSLEAFERSVDGRVDLPWNWGWGFRPIFINGPARMEPKQSGRVTHDWPVLAKVDGGDRFLADIAHAPVFPSSQGFNVFTSSVRWFSSLHWRRNLGYAILSYPENEKSGLCLVQQVNNNSEAPVNLNSFTVKPTTGVSSSFAVLGIEPDFELPQAVVEIADNESRIHSLGRFSLSLTLQVEGNLLSETGSTLPSGVFTLAVEFDNQSISASNARGVVTPPNLLPPQRNVIANIKSISHSGGSYSCENVVLGFAKPIETLNYTMHFTVSLFSEERIDTVALIERLLVTKAKIYISWLPGSEPMQLNIVRGYGHYELLSGAALI